MEQVTGTERAIFQTESVAEVRSFLSAYAQQRLGSAVAEVRFRLGRIDAVWGVELADGREVVIKTHRLPVDLDALDAAREAKRLLRSADFPCPEPLAGPDEVDDRVVSVETLESDGEVPDGRDPGDRRLLAEGLARHIDVLRARPDLLGRVGAGPSWCHYEAGPWPVPHDPIVDFRSTPDGYAWLDAYATRAAEQVLAHRPADRVVGHADWYAGNTAVAAGRLVGSFDWELVADAESVIAGFTAACYAASSTSGGGLSTPEEVVAFLQDYGVARGASFTASEQRAAAGAAAWILAFNARWELALGHHDGATLALVQDRGEDYLALPA